MFEPESESEVIARSGTVAVEMGAVSMVQGVEALVVEVVTGSGLGEWEGQGGFNGGGSRALGHLCTVHSYPNPNPNPIIS